MMRKRLRRGRRRQQGNVIVFTTIALTALLAFAAWSTETGQAWTAKAQLQAAADAAALAGAGALIDSGGGESDPSAAIAAAQSFGAQNRSIGVPTTIPASDIQTGSWDLESRSFTPLPGSTDPEQVRAVRVLARRDAVANGPVLTVLGRIFGVDDIAVAAEAIAYRGFQGSAVPGEVDLPLVIDCSEIAGSDCSQPYCPFVVDNPPNYGDETAGTEFGACELADGTAASCLDTHEQGDQVACWTNFSDSDATVNTPTLVDIVRNGNSQPLAADSSWYIDNGVKVPVYQEIYDRMHGEGAHSGHPAGTDTNGDGVIDSWVVKLPVVESQEQNGCARGGQTWDMVGFVCFEIQQVVVEPDKRVKGRFVCPADESDPRFDECAGGGSGGDDFGVTAVSPVLVW